MFEAKLVEGNILKKIVEAIKDVVNDVNIDVSPSGKHPTQPAQLSSHKLGSLFFEKSYYKFVNCGQLNSLRLILTSFS